MVNRFQVRDTQRDSELLGQKKEERDRDDQEEKRENQKGREQSSQQSIPYVLSTVWNTQRGSQSYIEKRRGRKEIEVTRRKEGELKGERQIQLVISSLCVLHSPEHPKRFTELDREEKREGGDRGDLWEKKESQKWERAIKPVITLLSKNGY